jgi:hypothetical protein
MHRLKPVPQRVVDAGERAGRVGCEAEEQVHVAVSQIRTFGVGAGEGDGFEVFVIAPRAEQ